MLALETETKRKTIAPEKLLEAYLANARLVSDSIPKRDAKEAVRKNLKASASMLSDFKKSPESKRIIREKEKQLSEKAAKFPFKTKLNYAVDAEYGSGISAVLSAGIVSGIAVQAGSFISDHPSEATTAVMAGALGYALAKSAKAAAAFVSKAGTESQEKKIEAYSDIKHTLLALKMLKREILSEEKKAYKNEVAKLYASYGNPSGGLIHKAAAAKTSGR